MNAMDVHGCFAMMNFALARWALTNGYTPWPTFFYWLNIIGGAINVFVMGERL